MIISRVKLLYQIVTPLKFLFSLGGHQDCLSVITADEEMVRNLMSSVNISKATGYHGISDKIIIHCSEGLCKPFTSLINTSFRLGQYPSAWKLANVLPLLKKRSPSTED